MERTEVSVLMGTALSIYHKCLMAPCNIGTLIHKRGVKKV